MFVRPRMFCVAALIAPLCACAPSQEGPDQCKNANVDLLATADAKYLDLPEAEGGLSAATRDAIDGAVQAFMSAHETPIAGCALAVARRDRIAYLQGYGLADAGDDNPETIDRLRAFTIATPAPIGSISKTLTALGLMVYVQQNGLSLDDPLLDQMGLQPGSDVGWTGNPTLRQVLAHQGGFSDDYPLWDDDAFHDGPTIAAAFPNVERPGLHPLLVFQGYKTQAGNQNVAQIGTAVYSNVGYSLLGALLDYRTRDAGTPAHMQGYERFIWHTVARGPNLTGPSMISACLATDFRTKDIKNLASGYTESGTPKGFGDSDSVGWGWEGPSGGWAMTIGDLGRLMLILQSSAVVDKGLIDTEMRATNGPLFGEVDAGLGLELDANGQWFGKGGDILGYTADMKIWPSANGESWGVAFLCNQRNAGKSLTGDVYDVLAGRSPVGGTGRGSGVQPQTQAPPDPTTVTLVKRYEPVVRAYAARYLADGASPEQAWARARRDLARLPNGPQLVQAVERGEFDAALRLLPTMPQANTVTTR